MSIFAPTSEQFPMGTRVLVRIAFSNTKHTFMIAGVVAGLVNSPVYDQPGMDIAIETDEEQLVFSDFVAFCRGRPRANPRYVTSLDCSLRIEGDVISGVVRDLSITGAFVSVALPKPVEKGALVEIEFKALWGLKTLRFAGQVAWSGPKGADAGVGVRFLGNPLDVIAFMRRHHIG